MTATLKNDVGPEDFGISTMDAEKARHYAAFLVAADRGRIAALEREVLYLRHYGNKYCTHMADAAMERRELDP